MRPFADEDVVVVQHCVAVGLAAEEADEAAARSDTCVWASVAKARCAPSPKRTPLKSSTVWP